jgi:hypothetical protein
MPITINDLTDDQILGHAKEGSTTMIGLDVPSGFYTGKRLREAGFGVCGLTRWLRDNTPWIVFVDMTFGDSGSMICIRFLDESDGSVARSVGPFAVMGGRTADRGFSEKHEAMGWKALLTIAQDVEARLVADGTIL